MVLLIHAHPHPESLTLSIAAEIARSLRERQKELRVVDLYRLTNSALSSAADNLSGPPRNGETSSSPHPATSPVSFPPLLTADELRRKTSLDSLVQTQMDLVERADGYIVVHPDWWGGPPAVLKGWLDRVLRPGTAYEVPEGYSHREAEGLLNGRRALVVCTGDADDSGPLEDFWIRRVWAFCGVSAQLRYFPRLRESNLTGRRAFIDQTINVAKSMFP